MNRRIIVRVAGAVALVVSWGNGSFASARTLFSNGGIVTNPTGGTGPIAGQPISNAEPFVASVTTSGVGAGHLLGGKAADDFTVPAGGWDLDAITLYGFQSHAFGATTFGQTVTKARINLWTAAPFDANSPALPSDSVTPPPGPVPPRPLLAEPLVFDVTGRGTLVAHRQTSLGTNVVRPVYAWTVSADGLPDGGRLDAGTYWLEFSLEGVGPIPTSPSNTNVLVPLVTPRAQAATHNARIFANTAANSPLTWFEGREGYIDAARPGRAYSLPFEVVGTPEPTTLLAIGAASALVGGRRRR